MHDAHSVTRGTYLVKLDDGCHSGLHGDEQSIGKAFEYLDHPRELGYEMDGVQKVDHRICEESPEAWLINEVVVSLKTISNNDIGRPASPHVIHIEDFTGTGMFFRETLAYFSHLPLYFRGVCCDFTFREERVQSTSALTVDAVLGSRKCRSGIVETMLEALEFIRWAGRRVEHFVELGILNVDFRWTNTDYRTLTRMSSNAIASESGILSRAYHISHATSGIPSKTGPQAFGVRSTLRPIVSKQQAWAQEIWQGD